MNELPSFCFEVAAVSTRDLSFEPSAKLLSLYLLDNLLWSKLVPKTLFISSSMSVVPRL